LISRSLSRWCRPIDGSSRTYSTPDSSRAELRRQADALGLAARQRARGAIEGQVLEADVEQERQPVLDLLQDLAGDLRARAGRA
jgi:hypothetical protein